MSTRNLKTRGISEIPRDILLNKYADSSTNSRLIQLKGHQVHIRENINSENKPVLLGLHGICDSLHTWENWEKELEKHFRFIRIDLPYFGLTKVCQKQNLDRNFYNYFISELLAELGLEKVNLLGHSLGAYISWNFASFQPESVDRIVLVSPPAYPQKPPPVVYLSKVKPLKKIAKSYTPKLILPLIMKKLFYSKENIQSEMVERYYDLLMCEGNRENYMKVFELIMEFSNDYPHKLKTISNPMLILWGENDLWVPASNAAKWQQDVPHAKIKIYSNMRHMPQYENSKETLKEFLDFFQPPFAS